MTYNGETLAEFAHGKSSGWLYYVNGELPKVGITAYTLKDGDKVEWLYTSDYKQESGGSSMGSGGSSRDPGTKSDKPTVGIPVEWVNPYTDVQEGDWYFDAVRFVSEKKLFSGMTATEFAPGISLSRAMLVTVLWRYAGSPAGWENPFTDVPNGSWFTQAVAWAAENGIVNGVGNGMFEPESSMTRAMLVTVLWRYAGQPQAAANPFTDVPGGEWYTQAVAWAAENGVVNGIGGGKFDPNGRVTREQAAAILFRYAQYKGLEAVTLEENLGAYTDADQISEYAVQAFNWVVGQGLMTGVTDTTLEPASSATRAQVATILMRYCQALKE